MIEPIHKTKVSGKTFFRPIARCPKCKRVFAGWALNEPGDKTCHCGTRLIIKPEGGCSDDFEKGDGKISNAD